MKISEAQIETNKQRFIDILSSVDRPGIQELLAWLEKTDFYVAPSSATYHNNCKGGLCAHSLNVYDVARKLESEVMPMSNKTCQHQYTEDELKVSCLLHDLCKIAFYVPKEKVWKDESAPYGQQWKKYQGYEIVDKLPLGHGEKSVMMAQQFIKLSLNEMVAIRWHMGAFSPAITIDPYEKPAYNQAINEWPLAVLVAYGDQLASMLVEETYDLKREGDV